MSSNIVVEWLRSLHLGQYSESFIDNGYDDLEICKQVGDPDLDAIGVFNPAHRNRLLQSVRTLREEGAASVYFTLEETTAIHEECLCDTSSVRSSRTSSGNRCSNSDKELLGVQASGQRCNANSPGASSSNDSAQELGKYLDEYEEGKAELVRIPRIQLKLLLKDQLHQDGIRLSCQPYSTSCGERGYLEGLASRYADRFCTHYCDVLEHLEDLRRREWDELSPRIRVLVAGTPGTPPSDGYSPCGVVGQHSSHGYHGLSSSHSQPIYVPGKYSPSSCLSDKEEDEIYGFGYGVYGKQMMQRQNQHKIVTPQPNYQSCLSPRSAYFYEFPPNEHSNHGCNGSSGGKKKTSFSRFLRGLKTATGHRKDKSPRHRTNRVGTPDSLDGHGAPPPVDPRDYDRMRCVTINGAVTNDFEETIHRLKVQEVMKKRERFHKEHEDILRDIRHGLLQIDREGGRLHDDTYMYDEDARCAGLSAQHWYDEPPFESDPEDFLMDLNEAQAMPHARNSRVCFTLNLRNEPRGEARVISLRSAGDISLPREQRGSGGRGLTPRGSARRGLLVAGNHPVTIIDRGSGDYAGSDVQSIGSRLSTMSIDTSRSEHLEAATIHSPSYGGGSKSRPFRKLVSYKRRSGEEAVSASQSSDYEEQEDSDRLSGSSATRRHHHHQGRQKQRSERRHKDEAFPSTSSVESIPSGSGSSTQALVAAGSNHSSISADDQPSPTSVSVIGRARALVDYNCPYDKQALRFKKGDLIDVISMNASGLWKGVTSEGRVGTFKFINVEMMSGNERPPRRARKQPARSPAITATARPGTVEELLKRIGLEEHISVFVLNGYEDLELFKELESPDLDYLGIRDAEHRAKILSAIQLLRDMDSDDTDGRCSTSEDDELRSDLPTPAFRRLHFPRDSGCYDASTNHRGNFPNNLDSGLIAYKQSLLSASKSIKQDLLAATEKQNFMPNIPVVGQISEVKVSPARTETSPEAVVTTESVNSVEKRNHSVTNSKNCVSNTNGERNHKSEVTIETSNVDKRTPSDVNSKSGLCESYVVARGKLVTVEPCAPTEREDACEANSRLAQVKYVVGGATGEAANNCSSEKSSDSGVSSSSLSSAPRDRFHPGVGNSQPKECV